MLSQMPSMVVCCLKVEDVEMCEIIAGVLMEPCCPRCRPMVCSCLKQVEEVEMCEIILYQLESLRSHAVRDAVQWSAA
jgi:hypothetical protein